jgi:predicted protein tyrosine phosphatase
MPSEQPSGSNSKRDLTMEVIIQAISLKLSEAEASSNIEFQFRIHPKTGTELGSENFNTLNLPVNISPAIADATGAPPNDNETDSGETHERNNSRIPWSTLICEFLTIHRKASSKQIFEGLIAEKRVSCIDKHEEKSMWTRLKISLGNMHKRGLLHQKKPGKGMAWHLTGKGKKEK